jgi:hypothetical protein
MIEAFNCLARSTAYAAAFLAVFDPSDGTKIFEIIKPPLIIEKWVKQDSLLDKSFLYL